MRRTLSAAVALSISLFIYLFYRSEKTLVNEVIIFLFSFDTYITMKAIITGALPLTDSIVFSLPGGLWVFYATILSRGFYVKIMNREIKVSLAPVLFAIGLEFFQLFNLTSGRFDLWDIAFYGIFWFIAYYSSRTEYSNQNILSPFTFQGFLCVASFLLVYLAHVNQ